MKHSTAKIPGLTGPLHSSFVLKFIGARDYAKGQLIQHPAGLTSPFLMQKASLYEAYVYKLFEQETKKLAPFHKEAATLGHELSQLADAPPVTGDSEDSARQAAARKSRCAAISMRQAAIQAELEMMHLQFRHLLSQVQAVFEAKTIAYWKGMVAASNDPLPAVPAALIQLPDADALFACSAALITMEGGN